MIIDCHTHAYPIEIVTNPRKWALTHNELHWANLVAPTDRPSIQGWSNLDSMLTTMDSAGVDKAVLLAWYWEHESTCRWHNAAIAEWIQAAPERLIAFAAITPNSNVIDQLETAKALGFRGVGELHLGVQKFDAANPHWQAMANWCVDNDWPINCHATETAGHDHPGSIPTPLQEFVRMAEATPALKLILAHWGGGLAFFEQNPRLRKRLRNVYYDTAASPLLYEMRVFRQMIELVGIDKLLFGSDYPLRLYPQSQKTPEMIRYIEHIRESAGLNAVELAKLLGDNCKRMLKLD
ncbi:amidohydrolase family protein [Coraliomargarita sp. SDUM461004]|uniref:Amidohydrolase family protein n=1 Tax=Thalassobacterium sedimentorum TaxID=3041258 RepID=A0ABU1AHR0_9BACT|nr:amidohydrolase family protein [Coraliomargarita sp. SDUM461004]MDQ8194227.1 amidohydrolase family protein [Coraliomargarita sp. SDUM461004]